MEDGAGSPPPSPLDGGELIELRQLLASATPQRRARALQDLLGADEAPLAAEIRHRVEAEAAAAAHADEVRTELSDRLGALREELLGWLNARLHEVDVRFAELRSGQLEDHDLLGWTQQALAELLAGRQEAAWERLRSIAEEAKQAKLLLDALGSRDVTLPDFPPVGRESVAAQLAAAEELVRWLREGGSLRRRFPSKEQRAARFLLDAAYVDGAPVGDADALDLVIARMRCEKIVRRLTTEWSRVGLMVDSSRDLPAQLGELLDAHDELCRILQVAEACASIRQGLAERSVHLRLSQPEDFVELRDAAEAAWSRVAASVAARQLERTRERLDLLALRRGAAPELRVLAEAVAARDVGVYARVRGQLGRAPLEQAEQRRADELLRRLSDVAPSLAEDLERDPHDESWDERLVSFAEGAGAERGGALAEGAGVLAEGDGWRRDGGEEASASSVAPLGAALLGPAPAGAASLPVLEWPRGESSEAPASVSAGSVRRWARGVGFRVRSTGRLPREVIEAWNLAHPDEPYLH